LLSEIPLPLAEEFRGEARLPLQFRGEARLPLQGSYRIGLLPSCGRLPWAVLGRAFGAENNRPQESLVAMAGQLRRVIGIAGPRH